MLQIEAINEMARLAEGWCQAGLKIHFVPTMGALHAGHAALMAQAREDGHATSSGFKLVVSIFVNARQFNDPTDYAKYPKSLEADLSFCQSVGVDCVFTPSNDGIYPSYEMCTVQPPVGLAQEMEGKSRCGHFVGVLTVVSKLFNIVRPHRAYFGEKDFQQLTLVKAMVRDLNMNAVIVPVETVRECDLLPLSSRNSRLNYEARQLAPVVHHILKEAAAALTTSNSRVQSKSELKRLLEASASETVSRFLAMNDDGGDRQQLIAVDYLELRDARDLSDINFSEDGAGAKPQQHAPETGEARLLTAVTVEGVRLLDNIKISWPPKQT